MPGAGQWLVCGDVVMGLFDALSSAVSGLQAQSFAMQNISGNIANSQTVAYKGINTNFLDLVPGDSVQSKQIAGGVIANSVATNTVQGTIQSTQSGTDIAINGNGYFIVQSPTGFSGNAPLFGGIDNYTRRGDFQLDANGYLVNGAGYYLEGIPIDPTTGNPTGSVAAPLQFQSNFLPASATTQITYALNLPVTPATNNYSATTANSELLNPADFGTDPTVAGTGTVVGSDVSTFVNETIEGGSITAYDATGTPANIQLRWGKIDSVAAGGTDTWELFYQTDSTATGATVAWVNAGTDFVFNTSGQLNPPITTFTLTGVTVNGIALGNIAVNSPTGSLTQYASSSGTTTVNNLQQNGYAAGQLESIAVSDKGNINGTFSNGQTVALAKVPLVHFNSPNNLKSLDGGAYQVTDASGPALAGASGKIIGQSLEASNTDIATEFTKLIVTQQAYSANTKVITTANQMSQDLLNVIR
jgi:flagellar hook protein FlgE